MSVRLGVATVRERLAGTHAWLYVLAASGSVCATGIAARTNGASGVDHTLLGVTLPLVVPLLCYALFECVHGRARTSTLLDPLARHGAERHTLTFGALVALAGACAAATALVALVAVFSARTLGSELVRDLGACAWGGALIGAAYAGLLAFGSRWGRAGRFGVLAGDLVFGSGSGIFALPWARGHARGLLGGTPVLDASPVLAAVVLALLTICCVLHTASRGPS